MDKTLFKLVLTVLALVTIITYFLSKSGKDYDEKYNSLKQHMESNVGKCVVMGGDTLKIVNYSVDNGVYYLSNGKIIDHYFFIK